MTNPVALVDNVAIAKGSVSRKALVVSDILQLPREAPIMRY